MFQYHQTLHFPQLRFYREDLKNNLYTLDWAAQERSFKKKVLEPALPETWEKKINDLVFSLSKEYLHEIQRNASRAVEEWSIQRSFDTVIRDMCLTPAIEHVWVAFSLLQDCIWKGDTNDFAGNVDSRFCEHAMAYKFWFHQTGRGLVRFHAHFQHLEDYLNSCRNDLCGSHTQDNLNKISQFLHEIDSFHKGRILKTKKTLCDVEDESST